MTAEGETLSKSELETLIERSSKTGVAEALKTLTPQASPAAQPSQAGMAQGDAHGADIALLVKAAVDKYIQANLSPSPKPGQTEMHMGAAGLVGTLDNINIPVLNVALPVGSAVLGTAAGMIVGNVVDIVMPSDGNVLSLNSLAQVAAAAGVYKFGRGLMGDGAARFAAGAIVFRVAVRVLPIGEWIGKISGALNSVAAGALPGAEPDSGMNQGSMAQSFIPQPSIGGPWA